MKNHALQRQTYQAKPCLLQSQIKRWIEYYRPLKSSTSQSTIYPRPLFPFRGPITLIRAREEEIAEAPPPPRGFDENGNRICFKCQGVEHIARECTNTARQRQNEEHPSSNGPPITPPSPHVPNQATPSPNGFPPQSRVGQ